MSSENSAASLFSSLSADASVRGETPPDIAPRCLELCKAFIGGAWHLAVNEGEDFVVSRITGGLTNQLYRVRLSQQLISKSAGIATKCTDAAVKFYQSKNVKNYHAEDGERHSDIIVNTLFSQLGLGPKVLGLFNDGMVLQFYEVNKTAYYDFQFIYKFHFLYQCEEFGPKHQKDPVLLKQLLTNLATVHHLDVPLRKEPNAWFELIEGYFNTAYDKLNAQSLIDKLQLPNLCKDPRVEFKKLRKIIEDLHSPMVFCHNDFRGSNQLVVNTNTPKASILLTDVECSAYGYRSHDIANWITAWSYNAFDIEKHAMPSDDVLQHVISLYVEACEQLEPGYSKQPENAVSVIMKEVKIFELSHCMFFIGFLMQSTESFVASVPFDAEAFLVSYYFIK